MSRLPLLLLAAYCLAQDFAHRGFFDTRLFLYPQTAPHDSGRVVDDNLLRYEASYRAASWFRLQGGLDARYDTHRQTERTLRFDWQDRSIQRPMLSLRRLSATMNRGPWTFELGKQFVRWGKADILNPTDRFAPRDFLAVVDNDFLGIPAARLTWESGGNTLDAIYQIRFTPSRTPLLNQRWVVLPSRAQDIPFTDEGSRFPGGPQFGLRWNRVARGFEYSLSIFEGYNHLPLLDGRPRYGPEPSIGVQRYFPKIRTYGGDAAVPLPWFTLKGEAAWFSTTTSTADEYLMYVLQLERQSGEWVFVGGYAGEYVTERNVAADFAPDRGLARAFLGRVSYTIDPRQSIAIETAVRQSGSGLWLKGEYSRLLSQHWRATASFTLIRGEDTDFLGQYHRNSHFVVGLRYSF
jgi:hypothetical protein